MTMGRSSRPPARTRVVEDDLRHLEVLHRILALLNDPAASATALAALVDSMPVLSARLSARFESRLGRAATSAGGLAALGNRVLEAVLLELLEDLTVLRSELDR